MTPAPERLARLHLVWLWFFACVAIVLLSGVTGAGMLDGGVGSALFGILFLIAAPFVAVGRLGVTATAWAPVWFQFITSLSLVLATTAIADRFLTRFLLGLAPQDKTQGLPPN